MGTVRCRHCTTISHILIFAFCIQFIICTGAVLYCTVLYFIILYSTVPYSPLLNRTVQVYYEVNHYSVMLHLLMLGAGLRKLAPEPSVGLNISPWTEIIFVRELC